MLDGMSHVLKTERLRLRLLELADTDGLLSIFGDPEAMRYYPSTKDREATESWIRCASRAITKTGSGCGRSSARATERSSATAG